MKGIVYGVVFEVIDNCEVIHSLHSTMEKALETESKLNSDSED